jgi:hypothetical protein
MNRSLIIAAALILAGVQTAKAADCEAQVKAAMTKCFNGVNLNIDPSGLARCDALSHKIRGECEAVNTVEKQKTLHPQPGTQPISKPGHIVPDLGNPAKLGTPENDD